MNRRLYPSRAGFTLIEVMVATVIVVILAGILISATDLTARSFSRTSAKIEQFSEARRGFEVMTRRLAEATLNTYFDYYNDKGEPRPSLLTRRGEANYNQFVNFQPSTYGRQSELRFVSGPMELIAPDSDADRPTHGVFFQAPVGEVEDRVTIGMLDQTLNSWGYFLEIAEDEEFMPQILRELNEPRRRSRLLEFRQPTEVNPVYFPKYSGSAANASVKDRNWWFLESIEQPQNRPVRVVAENVIALIVVPRLSRSDEIARATKLGITKGGDERVALAPSYYYDSTQTQDKIRIPPAKPLTSSESPEDLNPKNQLPPTVQVVMIALDENSGAALDRATQGKDGFDLELDEIFERSTRLEDDLGTDDPDDGELNVLEQRLINMKLTYRIFNTTVIVRGAKWSRAQAN